MSSTQEHTAGKHAQRSICFQDLPVEIQKHVVSFMKPKIQLAFQRANRHCWELASESIYQKLELGFKCAEAGTPGYSKQDESLPKVLETLTTSIERNYGQYVRTFFVCIPPRHSDDAVALALAKLQSSQDAANYLNTLLSISLRTMSKLEAFCWKVPLRLSVNVHSVLVTLQNIRSVSIRLSEVENKSPAPANTTGPYTGQTLSQLTSAATQLNATVNSMTNMLPANAAPGQKLVKRSSTSLGSFSKFKNLRVLRVTGIGHLQFELKDLAFCLTRNSSSLDTVVLSISHNLTKELRQSLNTPAPTTTTPLLPEDDDMLSDSSMDMPQPAPQTQSSTSNGQTSFQKQKQRRLLDSAFAVLFSLNAPASSSKVDNVLMAKASAHRKRSGKATSKLATLKEQFKKIQQETPKMDPNLVELFEKMTSLAKASSISGGKKSSSTSKKTLTEAQIDHTYYEPYMSPDFSPSEFGLSAVASKYASLYGGPSMTSGLPNHSISGSPSSYTVTSGSSSYLPTSMFGDVASMPFQQKEFLKVEMQKMLKDYKKDAQAIKDIRKKLEMQEAKLSAWQDEKNNVDDSESHGTDATTDTETITVASAGKVIEAGPSPTKDSPPLAADEMIYKGDDLTADIDLVHSDSESSDDGIHEPDFPSTVDDDENSDHEASPPSNYINQGVSADSQGPTSKGKGREIEKGGLTPNGVASSTSLENEKGEDSRSAVESKKTVTDSGKSREKWNTGKNDPEETMQEYLRLRHGLKLDNLGLCLIPIKPSLIARAFDLASIRRLHLLGVGPQGGFWTLMERICKERGTIALRTIQTDDVSLAFLQAVANFPHQEELFLMKRSKKNEEFLPTKKCGNINHIRISILRRHFPALKRLVLHNDEDTTWDLDQKSINIIGFLGGNLIELGVSMGFPEYHHLMQRLSGFKYLVALHIIYLRRPRYYERSAMPDIDIVKYSANVLANWSNINLKYINISGSIGVIEVKQYRLLQYLLRHYRAMIAYLEEKQRYVPPAAPASPINWSAVGFVSHSPSASRPGSSPGSTGAVVNASGFHTPTTARPYPSIPRQRPVAPPNLAQLPPQIKIGLNSEDIAVLKAQMLAVIKMIPAGKKAFDEGKKHDEMIWAAYEGVGTDVSIVRTGSYSTVFGAGLGSEIKMWDKSIRDGIF
ncbi:hypothetical protein MMC25_004277 [Agyrium rufum]|nr:hypothetical protein [Agyrium rufum]